VVYDSNITDWVTAPYSDHANTLDKIGVNTSTPAEALDVVGRIQASDQVLAFTTDDASTPGYSWTDDVDTGMFHADSNVIAFSTAGLERMRVDDVGHVGIGVSNIEANSALHVDGDVRIRNADLVGACNIYTKTEVDGLIEDVDDNMAEGLYWDTETQRLGVSTVTPDAKLHVIGDTITDALRLSADGSAVDPALAWIVDPNTGIYRIADDVIGLSSGGQEIVRVDTNGLTVTGTLSKGSGTFNITHPLPEKKDTHRLVHSFIEGPSADLIYCGMVILGEEGKASVNIDVAARMTSGTFEALTVNRRRLTRNESGFTDVKSALNDAELSITAADPNCRDEIYWQVVAERNDDHIKAASITDEHGRLIVEPRI
jgi:hypothetical protein